LALAAREVWRRLGIRVPIVAFLFSLLLQPPNLSLGHTSIMSGSIEQIIPLVAIVGSMSIPIFWFYFDSRNKASRDQAISKALESGAPLEDVKELYAETESASKAARKMPFRKGLILISLGAALLMSRELGFFGAHSSGAAGVFGLIGLFLGLAFLVSDFFNRKRF
jgi:hypothetical protein